MIGRLLLSKKFSTKTTKVMQLLLVFSFAISLLGLPPLTQGRAASYAWTAYNDLVYRSGQPETRITKYTIPGEGTSAGLLVNYDTGSDTAVTVTIAENGVQGLSGGGDYDGSEANSGTDAYNTFHGFVDSTGLILYGTDSSWYVDLTFTGLVPGKTYTFATTANRNNPSYISRVSRFTISDIDGATNASTTGVTVIDNETVAFNVGNNTVNGYVARWTGIAPGSDGDFKVHVNANAGNLAYGPSVFLLQEEVPPDVEITSVAVTDIDAPVALATPDVLSGIAATPTEGITNSTASVTWASTDNPFGYSTVYTASVNLSAASGYEFTTATTATVNGQPAVVILNGDGTLTISYTFPETEAEPIVYWFYLPFVVNEIVF